jgi:hypothetical protein
MSFSEPSPAMSRHRLRSRRSGNGLSVNCRPIPASLCGQLLRAPMIERRPFDKLPCEDLGWPKARHHFSFAAQHDPSRSGRGCLTYLERRGDRAQCQLCAAGTSNIEIITHVSERTVTHRDGLGNEGRIEVGNVQVVSANTGIRHAEHKLEQASARIPDLDHAYFVWWLADLGCLSLVPWPSAPDVSRQLGVALTATKTHCPFAPAPAC